MGEVSQNAMAQGSGSGEMRATLTMLQKHPAFQGSDISAGEQRTLTASECVANTKKLSERLKAKEGRGKKRKTRREGRNEGKMERSVGDGNSKRLLVFG